MKVDKKMVKYLFMSPDGEYPEKTEIHYRKRLHVRKYDHKCHYVDHEPIGELEKNALDFLYKRLEMFGPVDANNKIIALSSEEGEMECDDSLLSLYYAIHDFCEAGQKKDAFNIYYWVITELLGMDYTAAKRMIEMLSNYEGNASQLTMKHRDHYTHSVFVFLTGLAIFNSSDEYRNTYREKYFVEKEVSDKELADDFFRFWSITSLFHDIGYVYEIPFEQIKSYTAEDEKAEERTFFSYENVKYWSEIREDELENELDNEHLKKLNWDVDESRSLDDIFARNIVRIFGEKTNHLTDKNGKKYRDLNLEKIRRVLGKKASFPEFASDKKWVHGGETTRETIEEKGKKITNNVYMDHAYFSAMILFHKLIENKESNLAKEFCGENMYKYLDALTAIEMHNSLFKFVIRDKKPLKMIEHPLAYMLMLCDELQIWDRTSFGLTSKQEEHAMGCEMRFDNNQIIAIYQYNEEFEGITPVSNSLDKFCKVICPEQDKDKWSDFLTKDCKLKIENKKDDKEKNETSFKVNVWNSEILKKNYDYYIGNENSVNGKNRSDDIVTLDDYFSAVGFLHDIEEIVEINDQKDNGLALKVGFVFAPDDKYRPQGVSESSLMNIYELALQLYREYSISKKVENDKLEELIDEEEKIKRKREKDPKTKEKPIDPWAIDLEKNRVWQRLMFINAAKSMGEYLSRIGCFYSDKAYALHRVEKYDELLPSEKNEIINCENYRLEYEEERLLGIPSYLIPQLRLDESVDIINPFYQIPGMSIYRLYDPKEYVVVAEILEYTIEEKDTNESKTREAIKVIDVFHRTRSGQVDYRLPRDTWMYNEPCIYDNAPKMECYFADAFMEFGRKSYDEIKPVSFYGFLYMTQYYRPVEYHDGKYYMDSSDSILKCGTDISIDDDNGDIPDEDNFDEETDKANKADEEDTVDEDNFDENDEDEVYDEDEFEDVGEMPDAIDVIMKNGTGEMKLFYNKGQFYRDNDTMTYYVADDLTDNRGAWIPEQNFSVILKNKLQFWQSVYNYKKGIEENPSGVMKALENYLRRIENDKYVYRPGKSLADLKEKIGNEKRVNNNK